MSQISRSTRRPQSASARNRRRQLRRQLIPQLLDKLDRLHDLYPVDDPRREAVLRRIEHWSAAQSLDGRRSGGYSATNAQGICFQQVAQEELQGCS